MRYARANRTFVLICLLLIASLVVWVAVLAYLFSGEDEAVARKGGGGHHRHDSRPSLHYGFDTSDERKLSAYSDVVAVGTVEALVSEDPQRTTIPGDSIPQRRYAVRLSRVIRA